MNTPEKTIANNTRAISYFLGFISLVVFVFILMALQEILIPVTFAIFLTYLFHPLVELLMKYKIPKWVSVILILIFVFGVYYLFGLLVVSNYNTFVEKLASYSTNLSAFVQQILAPFNLTMNEFAQMLNIHVEQFDLGSIFQSLFKAGIIQDAFNSLTSLLGSFFIAMIFWIFMILGKKKFEERLQVAFASRKKFIDTNIASINIQLQSYIIIKTIISFLTGLIVTIILWLYHIDFALIWGILTFILNFIPNIGSLIATVCPILISLLDYGFGFTTISLTILLLVNQNVMGNIIEPNFLGRQLDLSPVFVLFSLIFWGWIWGFAGMFLAVPIAAAIKILFSNIEPLKPIAVIMGSKAVPIEEIENVHKSINIKEN